MAKGRKKRTSQEKPTLEMTPMIDCVFQLLIFFIVPLAVVAWRSRDRLFWAGGVAVALGVLYGAQVLVGALNVWYTFPDYLTVAHTVIAASIWFILAGAIILTYYAPSRALQANPTTTPAKAPA